MKKYFTINNQFKKYLPIFMIMLSIILLMGTSYALLRNSQRGEETYVMNVGLLEVTFLDSETNALTVENMVPTTDEEGKLIEDELEFTVKNTGSLSAKYNVYIEETSTNPEFKTVIRYISNKNDEGYNDPKTLSEDNYLDRLAFLDVGETATYKVKFWLSESADTTYMDKTFTARIVVDVMQGNAPAMGMLLKSINESTCNPSITDDDGTIYLSGTNDCVDFNYVWYSGKLWRITAIYPDGTMKMITEDVMTVMSYGANYSFYTNEENKSYVYQWLNEDFLDTLYNYENIIVTDYGWNATATDSSIYKPEKITIVNAKVGLLNSYENYIAYKNATLETSYLNIGYNFWLLNRRGAQMVWETGYNVFYDSSPSNKNSGVRPSIILKSNIDFSSGSGTKTNPYKIKSDKEDAVANTTLLNTRSSGEYVNFDGELYRIVGIENNTTKLNKTDYIRDENNVVIQKAFASTSIFGKDTNTQSDDYWDYYLNNTWYDNISLNYKNMLVKGVYYLGRISMNYSIVRNYKRAICSESTDIINTVLTKNCTKVSSIYTGYVGLPRFGEMFSSQLNDRADSSRLVLISPAETSDVNMIFDESGSSGNYSISTPISARPSIHLTSTVVITGGNGTENLPFEVSLP